jgi:hypothetical protein
VAAEMIFQILSLGKSKPTLRLREESQPAILKAIGTRKREKILFGLVGTLTFIFLNIQTHGSEKDTLSEVESL